MKTSTSMLKVQIDRLKFEKNIIIKNLGLNLNKGDVLFIYGTTGSGKTSILKVLSGLIPYVQKADYAGDILYKGSKIDFDLYRDKISFAFQEAEQQFLLSTVNHEIFLSLDKRQEKLANELISFFKIKNLIPKSLRDISTGQRKLVSIISILSQDKNIVMLDEPSSNLDEGYKKMLVSYLEKIKNNKIIIIASHDLDLSILANKFLIYDEKRYAWNFLKSRKEFLQMNIKKTPIKNYNLVFRSNENIMVILKEVGFSYPDGTIPLHNVSLDINKGDIVGLIGKNGSGKSTLIDLITGRLKPNKGRIIRKTAGSFGLVLQEPEKQLFTNTVYNELIFGGGSQDYSKSIILKILRTYNLERLKEEHPFFISRGQKQLLVILSVLLKKPDLIILDEPFTGLDNKTTKKIVDLILAFYKKYHPTIIISDQDSFYFDNIINKKIELIDNTIKDEDPLYKRIKSENLSLLVIKPECFKQYLPIKSELERRGYVILKRFIFHDFYNKIRDIYLKDYPDEEILDLFKKAYLNSTFSNDYYVVTLKHKKFNTINKLYSDIGHFFNYQNNEKSTLRAIFGKPKRFNYKKNNFTITFNGLHRVDDVNDLIKHLKLFKITLD